MKTLEIILTAENLSPLHLQFQISGSPIAQKWAQVLAKNLERPEVLPNTSFQAFVSAGRSGEQCWQEVLSTAREIQEFDGQYLPKNFENFELSQESLNQLHKSFEMMRGKMIEGTDFYAQAPAKIQKAIHELNEKIHETEAALGVKGGIGGQIKFCLQNAERFELESDDYKEFSMQRLFGDVYLHYCEVGKSWLDVFDDKDEIVSLDNIRPLKYYSGEFDINFGHKNWHASDEFLPDFYQWLRLRGLSPEDPKLALGWLRVASLVGTSNQKKEDLADLCAEIGRRQNLHQIKIS